MGFRLGFRRCSIQEIIFLLFFLSIIWPFRIVTLHLRALLRRQLREVAKHENKLPTVVLRAGTREGWHSRKSHPIFDHPEEFTIGEFLSFRKAQVGRLRVQPMAHHRIAAAVVSMTDGAVVGKVNPGVQKILRRGGEGICQSPGIGRNGEMSGAARHHRFEWRRRRSCAQAMMQNRGHKQNKQARANYDDKQNEGSAFHRPAIMVADARPAVLAPSYRQPTDSRTAAPAYSHRLW